MANGNNTGNLKIEITSENSGLPVENAQVSISSTGTPDVIIDKLSSDSNGMVYDIPLEAPPLSYSLSPSDNQPYSEYNIRVSAKGYDDLIISGIQILPNQLGIQSVSLRRNTADNTEYNPVVIDAHTLWEAYPPKIAENEVKSVSETGEIILSRVVVPETIVVHDGVPSDSTAKDYYVPYKDYIKNVACCEIYSTWPEAALKANILAIMSITLNRVYTEWYRSKGYDFTITSSTSYDQKWTYGKTIYENISQIVDELFADYLSKPDVKQPLFTQYCDGKRVTCPNWMSQWGSKALADDGLSTIEILRYYYGQSIFINTAETISGIPASYPGYDLTIGSTGQKVKQLQEQLNRIAQNYPAIPVIDTDGIYGEKTAAAVSAFQKIFNLSVTGVTNYATWYKISQIYAGVTKIAESV
jgi:hypothetical protein